MVLRKVGGSGLERQLFQSMSTQPKLLPVSYSISKMGMKLPGLTEMPQGFFMSVLVRHSSAGMMETV